MIERIKYIIYSLEFLKIYCSPFIKPKLKLYFGEIKMGVPYFYPRKLVNGKFVPLKFGFSFCSLGYKTKWSPTDYRFEWPPMLSFVAFNKQIVLYLTVENGALWEFWLIYEKNTDKKKSVKERIEQCKEIDDGIRYIISSNEETEINYYNILLKQKYIK